MSLVLALGSFLMGIAVGIFVSLVYREPDQ